MDQKEKPLPQETETSADYWASARKGVLAIQRCSDCKTLRHYPRLVCDNCLSLDSEWVEASGNGTLHSWTVAHHPFHPGFVDEVPYVLATVDLEEGPRALGVLDDATGADLVRGMSVKARFEQRPDGASELHFAPAERP